MATDVTPKSVPGSIRNIQTVRRRWRRAGAMADLSTIARWHRLSRGNAFASICRDLAGFRCLGTLCRSRGTRWSGENCRRARLARPAPRAGRVLSLSATTSWPVASFARTGAGTPAEGRAGRVAFPRVDSPLQERCKMLGGLPQNRSACAQTELAHHRRPRDVRVRCPTICPEVPRP